MRLSPGYTRKEKPGVTEPLQSRRQARRSPIKCQRYLSPAPAPALPRRASTWVSAVTATRSEATPTRDAQRTEVGSAEYKCTRRELPSSDYAKGDSTERLGKRERENITLSVAHAHARGSRCHALPFCVQDGGNAEKKFLRKVCLKKIAPVGRHTEKISWPDKREHYHVSTTCGMWRLGSIGLAR